MSLVGIVTALSGVLAMQPAAASAAGIDRPGTSVKLGDRPAQAADVLAQGADDLTLQNLHSRYVLAVAAGSKDNGAKVIQYPVITSNGVPIPDQRWDFKDSETPGWYYVVNVNSTKAMGVAASGTANGSKVVQWTRQPGNHDQQWRIKIDAATGWFELENRNAANRCLSIPAGSTAAGTQAVIYDCKGYSDQFWHF